MASAGAFGALIIHDRAGVRGEALPINNQKLTIGRQVPKIGHAMPFVAMGSC